MKRANETPTTSKQKNSQPVSKCKSCMDKVDKNDPAKLTCHMGCTICGECSAVFAESVLSAGSKAVVPTVKCPSCRAPVPPLSFERVLTPDQLSIYLSYAAMHAVGDGESLLSCVNCQYFEIRSDEPSIFWCPNEECQTVHCVGCKAKLPKLMDENDLKDEEDFEEFEEGQAIHMFHLQCSALRKEKEAFDKAMTSGSGMPCPGCQVVFRKDELCTHMSCSGCQTVWCYTCGLSVQECDKAPRSGEASSEPIYGHNEDWQNNPLRCPMYLSMMAEVDDGWDLEPRDDDSDDDFYYDDEAEIENACVDKFHRWRTLQKLRTLRDELGEEKWQDLRRTFASVRDCGFTDQEIKNAGNAPLFVRREPRSTKQQKTNNNDVVDLVSDSD